MEYILFYLAFGYAIIATIALVIYITRYNNVQKSQDILIKENISFLDKFEEQEEILRQKECQIKNHYVMFEDNKDFISSLNERVQKAEVENEKLQDKINEEKEQNMLLVDELKELRLKLSRKGTGTKGSKKILDISFDLASGEDQSVTYIQILGDEDMSQYYGCEFLAFTHENQMVTGYIFEDSGIKVYDNFLLITKQLIDNTCGFNVSKFCMSIDNIPKEFIDNGYFGYYVVNSSLRILFQSFSIVKRG